MTWRVTFVCTGNICRSPTAEGVLRQMSEAAGVADRVEAASAGLGDWHIGAPPDERTQAHALRRGYDLSAQRARLFTRADFDRFDRVVALDDGHHALLRKMCPPGQLHKLRRAADYNPRVPANGVPDPYYGDAEAFELVLDLVVPMCEAVLAEAVTRDATLRSPTTSPTDTSTSPTTRPTQKP
jgi:protein-tyrosine phosphatase